MRRDGYRVVRIRGGAKGWGAWPRLGGGAERAVDVGSLGKHQHKDTLDGRSINNAAAERSSFLFFLSILPPTISSYFVWFRYVFGTEPSARVVCTAERVCSVSLRGSSGFSQFYRVFFSFFFYCVSIASELPKHRYKPRVPQ